MATNHERKTLSECIFITYHYSKAELNQLFSDLKSIDFIPKNHYLNQQITQIFLNINQDLNFIKECNFETLQNHFLNYFGCPISDSHLNHKNAHLIINSIFNATNKLNDYIKKAFVHNNNKENMSPMKLLEVNDLVQNIQSNKINRSILRQYNSVFSRYNNF